MSEVALITAYNGQGQLLVGKRLDNERYTLPGGHLEPGESPEVGALRELYEETGLHAVSLSFLKDYTTAAGVRLHCFSAFVTGEPHGNNDPDEEVEEWEFIDVKEGLPPKVFNNLHGPAGSDNLVTQLFGLKKAESDPEPLSKREPGKMFTSDEWGTSKIQIPSMDHPDRPAYDAAYAGAIKQHYGRGLKRVKLSAGVLTPVNEVHNKSRFDLYRKMARTDKLPPLVVQRSGQGYKVLDGNHKYHGGVAAGKQVFDAFEVPMKKVEFASDDAQLNKRSLDTQCPHGLKAFLVNGEHLRNTIDSDFVQGGNPQRYPWIPDGEIWVDETTPQAEIPYVILHECDEANLMATHHEGYEKAHDQAQRVEDKYRHENHPGEELSKGEDEVERMLDHPNPAEKTLALKLNSVTPRHLQLAALDSDPNVHQAAMDHPLWGAAQGLGLMETSAGKDGQYPLAQQMAFLGRLDRVEPYHLAALARNVQMAAPEVRRAVVGAIAKHPKASDTLLHALYMDPATSHESRMDVVQHPNVSPDTLAQAITTGTTVPGDEARSLACAAASSSKFSPEDVTKLVMSLENEPGLHPIAEKALETHSTHPDLYSHLFQQARMKPTSGAAKLLGALMRGPSSTPEHADEIATRMPLSGLSLALQGPHVKPQHLDRAVMFAHSQQDKDGMSRLMDNPGFGARHFEMMLQKTEPLEKAVKPEHYKGIVKALDTEGGHAMVDAGPDLNAHPPEHAPQVEAYQNHVLNHEKNLKPIAGGPASLSNGISRKKVFHAQIAGQNEPGKFMVKPYHERVIRRAKNWVKYPIQGWAEMTSQALYHAGEIGHLHQKVHVTPHDMGPGHESEPALVINLQPGMKDQHEIHKPMSGTAHVGPQPEHHLDARKIAVMDMLANNLDRHGGNLMRDGDKLLSVDNSRSYQYIAPNDKYAKSLPPGRHGPLEDTFDRYHTDSAINSASPFLPDDYHAIGHYPKHMAAMQSYKPVFDWWEKVGGKVRDSFHKRLEQIKDPKVRAHLKRNFDARADWMDERAKFGVENYGVTDWHKSPIAMYRPGELTDEEKENARLRH